jgi:protein-S-isoprenylcysteine O-methyltransferase Ste14
LTLVFLGLAALFNSLWFLALLPVVLAVMRYGVIAREERYLAGKFGHAYLEYKSRVRRWI